ncbi:uncharacterized protein DNG_02386 [Cephalotrichum gorgonifer]|uniref:Heterokaryon incompatibility domain-containing protein n=1 Tax=Cephalotrichum gorgonifer TaxID=2041049 RepID=A0AAE8MT64_9PEZI|nr:uncharacterized protein DNG_02386 [Cephalotrichum gorgonifer]
MVINALQSPLGPGKNVPNLTFFFEPRLDSLLAASSTCRFSQWLIARWSRHAACDWEDLRLRSGEIAICMSYLSYAFDPFPIVEVNWTGLWDPKEEYRSDTGRCRVFDELHLDVVAAADDDTDKAKQIALMPEIYSKAVVTISASKAERAVDGFLQDIDLDSTAGLVVRLPIRIPGPQTLGTVFLVETRNPGGAEPIEHRGWTFQERYLSPRLLDFASNQLSWTCTTSREMPGYCDGWRAGSRDDSSGRSLSGNFCQILTTRVSHNGCHVALVSWHSTVETYTRRQLTLPKDRILAISGIAQRYSSTLQGRYFAGHWGEALPYDLLWSIGPGAPRQARPAEYQAPSWSWAAVGGGVTFSYAAAANPSEYPAPNPVVFDLSVHTALEEPQAPFGAVTSGSVQARGRIRPARWFGGGRTADQPHILHDRDSDGTGAPIPLLRMMPDAQEREFMGNTPDSGASIQVDLLHVGTCVGGGLRGLTGLVLRQLPSGTSDDARRRFVRLGIFHIDNPSAPRRAARSSTHPPEGCGIGDNQDFFLGWPLVDFEII